MNKSNRKSTQLVKSAIPQGKILPSFLQIFYLYFSKRASSKATIQVRQENENVTQIFIPLTRLKRRSLNLLYLGASGKSHPQTTIIAEARFVINADVLFRKECKSSWENYLGNVKKHYYLMEKTDTKQTRVMPRYSPLLFLFHLATLNNSPSSNRRIVTRRRTKERPLQKRNEDEEDNSNCVTLSVHLIFCWKRCKWETRSRRSTKRPRCCCRQKLCKIKHKK